MSFKNYDTSFASVLPQMRPRAEILAEIQGLIAGGTTEVARRTLAEIELHIKDGDSFYKQQQYQSALREFLQARALIYKTLYPGFSISAYLGRVDVALPVSRTVETALLNVSVQMADLVRPKGIEPDLVIAREERDSLPNELKPYTLTGFREAIDIEATLQLASIQGVDLLEENKPESAINVMADALNQTSQTRVDPALTAALELNLANAYLQANNPKKAASLAQNSLQHFQESEDLVGQAQALHLGAVSAEQIGNTAGAKRLYTQAAQMLEKASAPTTATRSTPTPVRPAPDPAGGLGRSSLPQHQFTTAVRLEPLHPDLSRTFVSPKIVAKPLISRELKVLEPIAKQDSQTLTYRIPGREDGWGTLTIPEKAQKRQLDKAWTVGVPIGEAIAAFKLGNGVLPKPNQVVEQIYQRRTALEQFKQLDWKIVDISTTTFYLTHLYAYVLPVKIGDAYNELGQYQKAENYFLQASKYTYLNRQIEAIALWNRLARNALEWGDSLYKAENLPAAQAQYAKLITANGTVPDSFLYTTAALSVPATAARTLIDNILQRPLPEINWEIAINVLFASSRIQQILQGLDYYGLMLSPIHTFEYLQSVARGFAQEAIQAEREFVNFKSREEMEETTRRDLETTKAMAEAEAAGRYQQYLAAREDEAAARAALDLAVKRRDDAIAQRNEYANASSAQIWAQAAAQALGGGEDALYSEISELANRLERGETISGPGPKLAAAQTLSAGRKTREYELSKMQDNIDELTRGIQLAQEQYDGAQRRTAASEIAWQAALQRADMADAALDAFDGEFFTPETWNKMSGIMRDISRSYLFRAIRIAKLMERAYNFENDTELKVIKNEYGHGVASEAMGRDTKLLGGDSLLKDIESFTYHAITTKTRKNSRIKDVISLASDFPAQFEAFRQTGLLSFETDLYEFDRRHPGFYGQRLEAVELEIVGLLPEGGLNGTLTAGGVTRYRKQNGMADQRVHQVDTMALSDFTLRNDVFLYGGETGVRGLFQGLGIGTTWQFHLPRRSNDFDFRRIFDVHLVLYYTAKYDPILRTQVLNQPSRPGELVLLRNYGLRYDFPDAWYGFYRNGITQFTLDRFRLPLNQQNFQTQSVYFRVVTQTGVGNQDITLRISGPNGVVGTVTTNSDGVVSSDRPELAALVGAEPLGTWQVEVISGDALMADGELKFDRIYNLQMGLEYAFEYVEEVI